MKSFNGWIVGINSICGPEMASSFSARFASPFEDNYCGSFKWTTTIWSTLVLVTAPFVGPIKMTRSQKSTKSNKESQPKSPRHPALWKAWKNLWHISHQTAANLIKLKRLLYGPIPWLQRWVYWLIAFKVSGREWTGGREIFSSLTWSFVHYCFLCENRWNCVSETAMYIYIYMYRTFNITT